MLQGDSESIKTQKAMLTQYAKAYRADETGAGYHTEQLKVENALEWVQRMNNIQVCAREIVEKEIVFT